MTEEKDKKIEVNPTENKVEEVKKELKLAPAPAKKNEAVAKGINVHASMKQCKFICKFIKGKSIDESIADLGDVIKLKKVVPFTGEIPHRKGRIMSGRYPINASKIFISILKSLKGNVIANQMDLDKTKIYFASANFASRPSKRGGGRFKRTNIILKARGAAD
jgi:ribosomal protein L22